MGFISHFHVLSLQISSSQINLARSPLSFLSIKETRWGRYRDMPPHPGILGQDSKADKMNPFACWERWDCLTGTNIFKFRGFTGWSKWMCFLISLWQTLKNENMAKPNHFCSGYMWTFLYFGVSVWPGEKILSFRAVPIDTSWRQQALSATLKQHLGGSGDVVEFCWCQFVSVDVNLCMDGVWRMYWGYLDGVSVCLWCSDVSGCSSLAGWRIYTVLAQPS